MSRNVKSSLDLWESKKRRCEEIERRKRKNKRQKREGRSERRTRERDKPVCAGGRKTKGRMKREFGEENLVLTNPAGVRGSISRAGAAKRE